MSRYLACLAGDNSLEPMIMENDIAIVDRERILADRNDSIMAVETNGRTELIFHRIIGSVIYFV